MLCRTIIFAVAITAIANVKTCICNPLIGIEVNLQVNVNPPDFGAIKAGDQSKNIINSLGQGSAARRSPMTEEMSYQFMSLLLSHFNGVNQTHRLSHGSTTPQRPTMKPIESDWFSTSTEGSATEEPFTTTSTETSSIATSTEEFTTHEPFTTSATETSPIPSSTEEPTTHEPSTITTAETSPIPSSTEQPTTHEPSTTTTTETSSIPSSTEEPTTEEPSTTTTTETSPIPSSTEESTTQQLPAAKPEVPAIPDPSAVKIHAIATELIETSTVESTTLQPLEREKYKWAEYKNGSGFEPAMVIIGVDSDNATLVVARANHTGDMTPGEARLDQGIAYIPNYKEEHVMNDFEVLLMAAYNWVPEKNGRIPSRSVRAGRTQRGHELYVGRTTHDGVAVGGKVHPKYKLLYYPYHGIEYFTNEYEVLVESDYRWVNYTNHRSTCPGMVIVDNESEDRTWVVGRSYSPNQAELVPGLVLLEKSEAYGTYAHQEFFNNDYEVLLITDYEWVPASNGNVPDNAVVGGQTSDNETLYVGRVTLFEGQKLDSSDGFSIGKIQPSEKCLLFSLRGKEERSTEYEVLVAK